MKLIGKHENTKTCSLLLKKIEYCINCDFFLLKKIKLTFLYTLHYTLLSFSRGIEHNFLIPKFLKTMIFQTQYLNIIVLGHQVAKT